MPRPNGRPSEPSGQPSTETKKEGAQKDLQQLIEDGAWNKKSPQLLENLLKSEQGGDELPGELRKDKRKRRRKSL